MGNTMLAKALNVANNTVSTWTSGQKEISLTNLVAVCDLLNIREEWLLHGILPMYRNAKFGARELALLQLLWPVLLSKDADRKILRSLGEETVQSILGTLATNLSDKHVQLLKGALTALQYGKEGEVALDLAIAAFEQLHYLDDHQDANALNKVA